MLHTVLHSLQHNSLSRRNSLQTSSSTTAVASVHHHLHHHAPLGKSPTCSLQRRDHFTFNRPSRSFSEKIVVRSSGDDRQQGGGEGDVVLESSGCSGSFLRVDHVTGGSHRSLTRSPSPITPDYYSAMSAVSTTFGTSAYVTPATSFDNIPRSPLDQAARLVECIISNTGSRGRVHVHILAKVE